MAHCRRRWVVAAEVIRYGNSPAAIRALLLDPLGVPVHVVSVPNPRPVSFVLLEPSGGGDRSVIHGDQLLIVDSWASSPGEAWELAQDVQARLKAIRNTRAPNGVLVYSARPAGGIVWMPDPDADVPRFRQNFMIVTRGQTI